MRLAFFVNDMDSEQPEFTTTRLAMAAVARDHEVFYLGADDFAYDPDDRVHARAARAPTGATDADEFLADVQSQDVQRIPVEDLDVLMLRNDPAQDLLDRAWAQRVGIAFGEIAARRGVFVCNNPRGLALALDKLYFQAFPSDVRPVTLITRDHDEVKAFIEDRGGSAVLKPLQGSGGHGVFLARPDDDANINQMIEAVARDGYIVAQEYLPAGEQGDVRLFVLEGEPLQVDGTYAGFRRAHGDDDLRSNMHAGGKAVVADIDDTVLRIAAQVGPKLADDGMFLAGLDIVGDKLMEVNVFSPGGLGSVGELTGVDFCPILIEALERKAGANV